METKPSFTQRCKNLWKFFTLYEKIWFFSILILAFVFAFLFPEEDVNGINGKWLKPEEPKDIGVSKFFKILASKTHFQTDEEFIADWNKAGEDFLQWVRKGYWL